MTDRRRLRGTRAAILVGEVLVGGAALVLSLPWIAAGLGAIPFAAPNPMGWEMAGSILGVGLLGVVALDVAIRRMLAPPLEVAGPRSRHPNP